MLTEACMVSVSPTVQRLRAEVVFSPGASKQRQSKPGPPEIFKSADNFKPAGAESDENR
jgi:hypothetical protein